MMLLTTTPEVATVTSGAEFEALAGEWDDLVRAMPRPSPFMLHGWLAEWWRHYGRGTQLAVLVARDGDRLAGALPLVARRRAGLQVATLMGGRQSVLGDLLVASGAAPAVPRAICDALRAARHDLVDLYGLAADSRIAEALGPALDMTPRIEAPVLDLSGGWEATYEAKTPSKRRSLHRRRRRQLAELGEVSVDVARTPEQLDAALDDAFRLHRLRWDGRPDGSGFATAAGMRFHRDAYRRLARQDVPRIVTLRLDGRAIAFHAFFALERTMYVHRLAFDPELGRVSPGLVNTLDTIEAAAAEGLQRVEYLGGGERYKLELCDRLEPLHHGLGLESGPRARALVACRRGAMRTRMRLKRDPRLRELYFERLAPARRVVARSKNALRV
jgi:CelD/BcsL family acetyltransferase involved in cellulose biosynthesis